MAKLALSPTRQPDGIVTRVLVSTTDTGAEAEAEAEAAGGGAAQAFVDTPRIRPSDSAAAERIAIKRDFRERTGSRILSSRMAPPSPRVDECEEGVKECRPRALETTCQDAT
ncbi:hypothetical protein [Roseateles chitosanitabidus]|uniref:hypothetical protein n=1 Tax=Roseateles chitosanitabidus TaxID=65048 RepID=UPI0011DF758A|nr:hypothetical protein [Roseateles chitosanitabidus]